MLESIHVKVGGRGKEMPYEIKQEILIEITSNEKKMGRRYTQMEILESTLKIMKRYAP